jgi:gliding motility-associated-like protein
VKLFLTFSCLFFLGFAQCSFAQLGFCSGNSGDPIFTETFGTGTNFGPPLPAGTTTYQFVAGAPQDGQYTISNNSGFFDWHNVPDRTPGDINGKMLVVNADFTAGEFFRIRVSGLCQGTSYEFSAWVLNLLPITGCGGNGIPINVGFQIWDSTDTILLASGDTGTVGGTFSPVWNQHALVFQSQPGQTEVILKMINNGQGGCGNDLAIDDIVFKSCGDAIDITDPSNSDIFLGCTNTVSDVELTANPDFAVFQTHAYQWQLSNDGNNWSDISGQNNQSYTVSPLVGTTFYRVKAAEDAANLQNELCNVISDIFELTIEPPPNAPVSNGNITDCGAEAVSLTVNVPNNMFVNWFDVPSGGNLITSNSTTLVTNVPGTYYAESVTELAGCNSLTRTAVTFSRITPPTGELIPVNICEGTEIVLQSAFNDIVSYEWSTGETTADILVNAPGNYSVTMINTDGCEIISEFTVSLLNAPDMPISLGDVVLCNDELAILAVEAQTNISINWYSQPTNGLLLQANNSAFSTNDEGTFYAEAVSSDGCSSLNRTAVTFARIQPPAATTQIVEYCEGNSVELNLDLTNLTSYNWSNGATTETIIVTSAGNYFVDVVNADGCETRYSFEVTEISNPQPPLSLGDVVNCSGEAGTLLVEVPNGILVNWYDSLSGGNLLETNSNAFTVDLEGTFYAEAVTIDGNCISTTRTAVNFSRLDPLDFSDEIIYFCEGEQITLRVEAENNVTYLWSTGETTPEITVAAQGAYSVDFVNANGCEATKNFELLQVNVPVISEVITNGFNIEIFTTDRGDFSYSIDGQNFQYSNIFYGIPGGVYTITVRDNFGCGEDVITHLHFVIPKFFTPNNDGFNDFFEIRGIQELGNSEVNIFDRYGKLLKSYKNSPVVWDGTYLGNLLPTNDYWYQIIFDGEEFTGHFTLKR